MKTISHETAESPQVWCVSIPHLCLFPSPSEYLFISCLLSVSWDRFSLAASPYSATFSDLSSLLCQLLRPCFSLSFLACLWSVLSCLFSLLLFSFSSVLPCPSSQPLPIIITHITKLKHKLTEVQTTVQVGQRVEAVSTHFYHTMMKPTVAKVSFEKCTWHWMFNILCIFFIWEPALSWTLL